MSNEESGFLVLWNEGDDRRWCRLEYREDVEFCVLRLQASYQPGEYPEIEGIIALDSHGTPIASVDWELAVDFDPPRPLSADDVRWAQEWIASSTEIHDPDQPD